MNVLFVCGKNEWRSRTAEMIFGNTNTHQFKSAGTDANVKVAVTNDLLNWADLVFVMEQKNRDFLVQKFGETARKKRIIVLDIPDNFNYMDEELILALKTALAPYLDTASER